MKFGWRYIRNYLEPKALVLMYHRIAETDADIWDIAVSPVNFEKQLQILKKHANVLPLPELTETLKAKKLKQNSVAITFDDGYIDNYLVAKPLLEKYNLPATFFITSTYLSQEKEFWWDELENLILYTPKLPQKLKISLAGNAIKFDLKSEANLTETLLKLHKNWKACEQKPPSLRCELFLLLWQKLRALPFNIQQQEMEKIRNWTRTNTNSRQGFKSMSEQNLKILASNNLFEIGSHTASHSALGSHNFRLQKQEMEENKKYLNAVTGRDINFLAYPYGNFNHDTTLAAEACAFKAAFTTEEKIITSQSPAYKLGRFQASNFNAETFAKKLNQWKNQF